MTRPLFLEFSNPVPDGHPLDLDAGNEFMLGRSILVAPPPYPEKSDEYKVLLPSGHWYNYWTGDLVRAQTNATQSSEDPPGFFPEVPRLDALPVFVREGSILPLQPVIQSTSELPKGPLMLRVYPGTNCQGSLYQDDGATMAISAVSFCECNSPANRLRLLSNCMSVRMREHINLGGKNSRSRCMECAPVHIACSALGGLI